MRLTRQTLLLAALTALPASAQEKKAAPVKAEAKGPAKETLSVTKHSIMLDGKKLEYEATAGTLPLKGEDGKVKASVFFIAYVKQGDGTRAKRPITFTFNGGPGSSSVWLHLGAFGPKRVLMTDKGDPPPPPYRLVDNEFTLLDLTDLVFIDPVSTGYSRPAPGQSTKQFHGVQEDIQSVGEFIRLYTTRFKRWDSPKYVAGESYGTTRAAGLAHYLQNSLGMNLNGVILVSSILNFQTARFDEGNDLPYILFLPTYTATAWYHKKLSAELADLRRALDEVEQFALADYASALMKGNKLTPSETRRIAGRLARYTGLSEEYIMRSNVRVPIQRFTKELLRGERRSVGRYDSRYKGIDRDAAGDAPDYDPSYAAVQGPFTATLNNYVRSELKYESDLPYEILTGRVQPWDFGNAKNRYLNMSGSLRQAMTANPHLRVFVANGYYDLATPYFATDYTFHHLGLDPALAGNVSMGYYDAGHMMYVDRESHRKLKGDLASFMGSAPSWPRLSAKDVRFKILDEPDPVAVGKQVKYLISVTHFSSATAKEVEVKVFLPNKLNFIRATGPTKETVSGRYITFGKVHALAKRHTLKYTIVAEGAQPGDIRVRAELRCRNLEPDDAIMEEESTRVYPP